MNREYYLCDTRRYVVLFHLFLPRPEDMQRRRALTIDREIDDVKKQVQREIDTIRDLMNTFEYRNSPVGWNAPFQVHRLRRALRIHYLALKIRESAPPQSGARELSWDLDSSAEL